MNTLDTALNWLSLGVTPIPCRIGTKIPSIAWGRWQEESPPQQLVERWFSREHNLALVTGDPLLVLDFDAFPVYHHWCSEHRDLAQSYTVATGRPGGRHVYFRCGKPISSMHLEGLDVRGTRVLVVAPPSVHPNGTLYESVNHGDILTVDNLSDMIPNWESLTNLESNSVKVKRGAHRRAPFTITEFDSKPHRSDLVGRIKAAFPILSILSRYTTPFPSSRDGRWYVMRCPHSQHRDANPSFWADTLKDICGCFQAGCAATQPNHRPMDIFNLLSWLTGRSNSDAIRELAREYRAEE